MSFFYIYKIKEGSAPCVLHAPTSEYIYLFISLLFYMCTRISLCVYIHLYSSIILYLFLPLTHSLSLYLSLSVSLSIFQYIYIDLSHCYFYISKFLFVSLSIHQHYIIHREFKRLNDSIHISFSYIRNHRSFVL